MARVRRIFGAMGDDWSNDPLPVYNTPDGLPPLDEPDTSLNVTLPQITITAPKFPWGVIVIGLAIAAYLTFFYKPSRASSC